jgi:hypothetical protein
MTFRNEIVNGLAGIGLLEALGTLVPGEQQSPETLRGALYGLMLIMTVMLVPRGVAGFVGDLRRARPLDVVAGARDWIAGRTARPEQREAH